eukprot:TRINITY_DN15508_c0_g1_i1.p1 TRINITY_DN15508_c0_g1~~TRINITY_DN15508_c0_g1_i1.p1  ORF type:complete len:342 (+),score=84.15 TRINITY_DN15508_c0_g1_i1:69-1028(+)
MLPSDRALIMEEYLRERLLQESVNYTPINIAPPMPPPAGQPPVATDTEAVLVRMQRDLESANDTIRVLEGERKTTNQVKVLYEEAKAETESYRKEAIRASTELETLKRQLADLQDKVRDASNHDAEQSLLTSKLLEAVDSKKRLQDDIDERESAWHREKLLLIQQVATAKEMRESVNEAYERGKRIANEESEQGNLLVRMELEDKKKVICDLEADIQMLRSERDRLTARTQTIADLETVIQEHREARNNERVQHTADHMRLREDVIRLTNESQDWRAAYETAERHKQAMHHQLDDLSKAHAIMLEERATMQARIELLTR